MYGPVLIQINIGESFEGIVVNNALTTALLQAFFKQGLSKTDAFPSVADSFELSLLDSDGFAFSLKIVVDKLTSHDRLEKM